MAGFEIALAQLPVAQTEVARVHGVLQDAVAGVDSSVSGLLEAGWRGAAAAAYEVAFREWHEGAQQVLRALDAMTVLLEATEQTYAVSDQGSAAHFGQVGSAL